MRFSCAAWGATCFWYFRYAGSHRRLQLPGCKQRLVLVKLRLELGTNFKLEDYLLDVLRRHKLAPTKKNPTYHRTHGGRCRQDAERLEWVAKAGQFVQNGRDILDVVGAAVHDQLEAYAVLTLSTRTS